MLPEKIWVLGTRTPACGGTVRLLIFSEIKAHPDESGSQCCMRSISSLVVHQLAILLNLYRVRTAHLMLFSLERDRLYILIFNRNISIEFHAYSTCATAVVASFKNATEIIANSENFQKSRSTQRSRSRNSRSPAAEKFTLHSKYLASKLCLKPAPPRLKRVQQAKDTPPQTKLTNTPQ